MGVDMSKVRARRLEHKRQEEEKKNNAFILDLPPGDTIIRILPPWSAENSLYKRAKYHYNVKQKGAFVCLRDVANQPCPACEVVEQLFKTKDQEDRDFAFKIMAKERYFANVLNLSKNDGKVYVFPFGTKLEKQIISMMDTGGSGGAADAFGFGDITDPVSGRNIRITKTVPADKRLTDYLAMCSPTSSPIANWDTIKTQLVDLDQFVAKDMLTYEQIQALLTNAPEAAQAGNNTGFVAPAPMKEVNPADEFTAPSAMPTAQANQFVQPVASTNNTGSKPDLSKTLAALRAQRGS